ncbi:MAG: Ig-like domain-containing protein [Acutalibacteraceae bacterium]
MKTTAKKSLSMLLAFIIMLSVLCIAPVTAGAATSSIKTQAEAVNWLNAQGGASYNIDTSTSGTQCVEFVKAYVNWLLKGNAWADAWGRGTGNGYEIWRNSLWSELGWAVYYNTPDFMPQPGDIFSSGTTAYGHTGVVISSNLNTAVIADANADYPYNGTPVKIHTINWRSASSNAAYGATHYIRPIFKTTHTHNYNIKTYRWKDHPHYQCYQCSCGEVKENRNEPIPLSTCSQCISEYKTVASINKSVYKHGEDVIVSWEKRDRATHYNVVLYKKNSDGNYKWYNTKFELKDLSYRISSLPVGEYYVLIQTYNSNYWTVDNSDWFHANGDTMYFTVVDNVLAKEVSLNKTRISLKVGETAYLKATLRPSNVTNKSLSWYSNNTNVIRVDNYGRITAKSAGTATITVKTSNGKYATCKVTVYQGVTSIKLNTNKIIWPVGKSGTFKATVSPSNAKNKAVSWKSSNTKVATVDSKGKLTAKGVGKATITCTAKDGSGKKATCTVYVTPKTPTKLTVKKASGTSAAISWSKQTGAKGYMIYRSTSKNGTYTKIKTTTSTKYTNTGLKKGKTYYYKVRAYVTIGNMNYLSPSTSVKGIKL